MRLAVKPDTFLERLGLLANRGPTPLLETQVAFTVARAIMAGAALGVFEALGNGERTGNEVAAACHTHPGATKKLLDCLVAVGYVRHRAGRYRLAPRRKKWLLEASPTSVVDKLVFQIVEWGWVSQLEDFVRTGEPVAFHGRMTATEWAGYQDAMRALAASSAGEVARKVPVPKGARRLLDIGGSHGLHSAALCRRHRGLSSTILELPAALPRARAIAVAHDLEGRITYRAGDALHTDLGEASFDLVFVSHLVHHFSADENRALACRVARCLRPGGYYVVGELLRPARPGAGGPAANAVDLYFALISAAGTWSAHEIASWQRQAGLVPRRPSPILALPGYALVAARKP